MTSVDELDEVLRTATRVRVTDGATALLDVADLAALDGLRRALAVERTTDARCACLGEVTFEFLDPAGRRAALVALHHGSSVRWSGWEGQALLRDGGLVLRWLADRGVAGPLARDEDTQRARHDARPAQEHWKAAAPAAVRDLCDAAMKAGAAGGGMPASLQELVAQRLTGAFPEPVDRAAALLIWYGSGTGRLSGFPVYEALPAPLLAALPIADLVGALEAMPADDRVYAGAVRHLCGWKSRKRQARDIARIPAPLRARLLATARESGDEDRYRRAERWLGARD